MSLGGKMEEYQSLWITNPQNVFYYVTKEPGMLDGDDKGASIAGHLNIKQTSERKPNKSHNNHNEYYTFPLLS